MSEGRSNPTQQTVPESVATLLSKQFPPMPFWMTSILPKNSVVLIGGHAKIGKSFFLGNLARALCLGVDFLTPEPGFTSSVPPANRWATPTTGGQQAKVLIIDKELGEQTLRDRLSTIFESDILSNREATIECLDKNLFFFSKDSGGEDDPPASFSSPESRKFLVHLCQSRQPNVIFLDPIGKMHHFDENSAGEIQKLYDQIEEVQYELRHLNCSFVITHHFGKPQKVFHGGPTPDPLDPYNFRGSSKWFDLPDNLIMLARKPSRGVGWDLEMQIKPRHTEEMPRVLLGMNHLQDNRVYFRRVIG